MLGGLSCNYENNACGEMLMVSVGCNSYLRCSVRWGFRAFLCERLPPTNEWRTSRFAVSSQRILGGMSEEG